MRPPTCFLLAALGLALSSTAQADNWPRFRGPNGTGVSTDKDIPVEFSATSGLLWKTKLPGTGNSSPIVWDDKVFLQAAGERGKDRYLLCLNASDGKILWKETLAGSRAPIHDRSSYASSTPATDGERVYAIFWDGKDLTIYAYTLAGKFVWKRDLGAHQSQHGAGISPIVYEGKVILTNDDDKAAHVLALDAKTGKDVWKAERKAFRACYSTPFLLENVGGPPQLIVGSTAGITSYNPKDGSENWSYTWKFDGMALRTVASPFYTQGLIVQTSGDGKGFRHVIAVKAGGKGDVTSTNLVWENKKNCAYVPCPLVYGEHIYSVTDKTRAHQITCQLARTGEVVWSHRLNSDVSASPVLIDGKMYVVDMEGDVHVFLAAPGYKELGKSSLGERVLASPAVSNNRLFIRGSEHLFCIGKK